MDKPSIIGPIKFSNLSFSQRAIVLDLTHQECSGFRYMIDRGRNPTMFLYKISGEIIGWSGHFHREQSQRFVREDKRGRGIGTKLKERVDRLRYGQATS